MWVLLPALAVGLALLVSVPLGHKLVAERVKPYTIQYKVIVTYPDGKELPPGGIIVAGKSNGDSMEQSLTANATRSLTLPAKGVVIAVAPSGSNIMTAGGGISRPPLTWGEVCQALPGHTDESKNLLGFRTFKTVLVSDSSGPAGNVLRHAEEAWVAPELNCQPLEKTETWTLDGQFDGVTRMTAFSAIAAEPNPSLFDLPEHPNEVPPSVFSPALGRNFTQRQEDGYLRDKAQRAALELHPLRNYRLFN